MLRTNIVLQLLAVLLAGQLVFAQEEDYDFEVVYPNPCATWQSGDPNVESFNLLEAYNRNRYQDTQHQHLANVPQVRGPTAYQVAYHIEERMNMTIEVVQAFPNGVPYSFSFESTFRTPIQPVDPWYLYVITTEEYEFQMSLIINPIYQTIEFSSPQYEGAMETISFREESIFNHEWHRLGLSLTDDSLRMWLDCKPLTATNGEQTVRLNQRGQWEVSEGFFSLAQTLPARRTVGLELQGMTMSCDTEKPTRGTCEDIPKYDVLPTEPDNKEKGSIPIATTTQRPQVYPEQPTRTCPEQCPRGPPGYDGIPGAPGRHGAPGPPGPPGLNSYNGNGSVHGQKGERGERGYDGLPGIQGPPGLPAQPSRFPQQNLANGTNGEKGERGFTGEKGERGYDGIQGPPGPPGLVQYSGSSSEFGEQVFVPGNPGAPGVPGHHGDRGQKGERGDMGLAGVVGIPGLNGIPGFKGDKGHTGIQGLEGPVGPAGPKGDQGYPGVDGLVGAMGPPGQCTCPQQAASLTVGPRGPPGSPGRDGQPGVDGRAGLPGTPGPRGQPGNSNNSSSEYMRYDEVQIKDMCLEVVKDYLASMTSQLIGPPGAPGKTRVGRPGPRGPQGAQGDPGLRGVSGERGYQGMPGVPGPRGDQGPAGKNGLNGERGEKGDAGIGINGNPGPRGYPGVPGRDGYSGAQGERGEGGRPGEEGPRGPPGQAGECPDCSAYSAYAAYPYMYQQNSKGPTEKG